MNKLQYQPHYVSIVPLWLSNILMRSNAPLSTVLSYSELVAITSPSDVCFYHLLQLYSKHYTGTTFDDMCNVSQREENLAWIEANLSTLQATQVEFDLAWKKYSNDIMGESVPATLRKYDYVPRYVNDDALVLLSVEQSPHTSARSFYRACIDELNHQMRYERYKTLNVFKQYCIA